MELDELFDFSAIAQHGTQTTDKPKRKNNPELLRHNILNSAKTLMITEGIGALSMQRVADMAGTSKGGLFHHYSSKETLIRAVIELFIAQLNTAMMTKMSEHTNEIGTFTCAYVQVFFDDLNIGLRSDWAGLIRVINADVTLTQLWQAWLHHKLNQHAHTDSDIRLTAIRHAVDGTWLNPIDEQQLNALRDCLLMNVNVVRKSVKPR